MTRSTVSVANRHCLYTVTLATSPSSSTAVSEAGSYD